MLELNSENSHQYLYNGQWVDAEVLQYQIYRKGSSTPINHEVVVTHFGPIVSDVVGLEQPMALRWTGHDVGTEAEAMLRFARATNWSEFKAALQYFETPAQNFVFADKLGNIAYRGNGKIPIRNSGDGLLPVDGTTSQYEWIGYIPANELPELYNPASGVIVTANHRVVDDNYPYFITHEWMAPYRAMQIEAELAAGSNLTLQDVASIQLSYTEKQAELLLPVINSVLANQNYRRNTNLDRARTQLANWAQSPVSSANSTGAAIYHYLYYKIARNIFEDELGPDVFDILPRYSALINVLDNMILTGQSSWINNVNTSKTETIDDIIKIAFEQTVPELESRLGSRVNNWQWGQMHKIKFEHYVGDVDEGEYNRGPYSIGGSINTPGAMVHLFKQPNLFDVEIAAPWRYAVSLQDMAGLEAMATGNSGHMRSIHYDDQMNNWLTGQYKNMYFDPSDSSSFSRVLRLLPQ
jgi:penicillin G amidase